MLKPDFVENEPTLDTSTGGGELSGPVSYDLNDLVIKGVAFASESAHHERGRQTLQPDKERVRKSTLDNARKSVAPEL
ncbi:MAG: hypothetical protein ACREGG_04085 [Candidatus Saccharimonadales bacterium]